MGWGFRKSFKIAPGVNINLSQRGPSISVGPKGMKYNVSSRGSRIRCSVPGTGIYYTKNLSSRSGSRQSASSGNTRNSSSAGRNDVAQRNSSGLKNFGFFEQLSLSSEEKVFIDGLKYFINGELERALERFSSCSLCDAYFMKGFIEIGREDFVKAEKDFEVCLNNRYQLGKTIMKVADEVELLLDVTEYIEVPVDPDMRGLYLCLVECYQKTKQFAKGIQLLYELYNDNQEDRISILSLVDFAAFEESITAEDLIKILDITGGIENDSAIEANIIYLRGYILYRLDKTSLAVSELSKITRKTKDRPENLILDIRFMRGQLYEELGKKEQAKKDYEFIYSRDSEYEGIKEKVFNL
ncbi:DUF4236 domain-containing protein [uncultured Clostridium sp.]|uniref:DUF4236 domain-containing protein n=1 Tax=uncultured Clostridium sp. TaxID=59620 RepID=UPI0025E01346|nr:DUF4236 domain-containing protein [uncultured Clostridium sp.]